MRRQAASHELTDTIWKLIVSNLRLQWSSEQIAGWLKLRGIMTIRLQRNCRRIRADRDTGGHRTVS